jgi:hypothetical protein
MTIDSIAPHEGALLALLVGFAGAALLGARAGAGWAGLALPLAALAGFMVTLGGISASPRQLPERLPLLAAGAALGALLLAALPRTWLALLLLLVAAMGGGWWVAGAPLWPDDIARAAPVWLVLALVIPVLYREGAGPWRAQMAVLALVAAIWVAGTPGPWWLMALTLAAAALPLMITGTAMAESGRLALAPLLAAIMAGPVLARGAPQDWVAAAAPLVVLLLGPRLAGRRAAWQAPLVLGLCAGLPAALAWAAARWLS